MKFLVVLTLTLVSNAFGSVITFDPEDSGYEETLYNYLETLGPDVFNDPYLLSLKTNGSIAVRGKGQSPAPQLNLRKLKQLKVMVVGVMDQSIKDDPNGHIVQGGSGFGRYCFYGCHCLPDAEHAKVSPPFGIPKDGVDRTCRQMGICYKCLEEKHLSKGKECKPEDNHYKFNIIKDASGQGVDIECLSTNECKRDICECDKAFALGVTEFEHEWDVNLHSTKSKFVRKKECKKPTSGGGGGTRGSNKPAGCCGQIPLVSVQKENDKCCGPTSYNEKKESCCDVKRGEVMSKGSC